MSATLEKVSKLLVEAQLQLLEEIERAYPPQEENVEPPSVEYDPVPPRQLKITVPEFLPRVGVYPTLFGQSNRRGPSSYSIARDRWYSLIGSGFKKALDEGKIRDFIPFERATVFIRMYFPDPRVRDVDNFTTVFINNALRYARIILDDSFDRLAVVTMGSLDPAAPRTEITVIEGLEILENFIR